MKKEDKLLNSQYDGIQEYDNALPNWWVWLFIGTIVFGVGYWAYYELGPGETLATVLASEMKAIEEKKRLVTNATSTDDIAKTLAAAATDTTKITAGATVYTEKCAACHGAKGEGLIGPNLTDTFWIHGNQLVDIKKIIENGVIEKGMLAWKGMLPESDIIAVVAFINSIKGTNPPNPKAPDGVEYK